MMGRFYRKTFPEAKADERKIRFDGFALGTENKAGIFSFSDVRNCLFRDGKMETGFGFSPYYTAEGKIPSVNDPEDPPAAFALLPYTDAGEQKTALMYVSETGVSYIWNEEYGTFDFTLKTFDDVPAILPVYRENGEAVLAFCGKDGVWLYDRKTEFSQVYAASAANAACVFHERLFFIEKPFTVRYCAPLDSNDREENADDAGYIEFPSEEGELIGLKVLNETVYLFRERGIIKLDAKGAARDFSAELLPYGGERIFSGSIAACGERIFFLAESGVYAFEERKISRVDVPVFPVRNGQVCECAAWDGKYFLRYADENGDFKVLILDSETREACFSVPSIRALSDTQSLLICLSENNICLADKDGDLPSGNLYAAYKENTDFGISGRKLWKTLTLDGEGACRIEVENEYEKRCFDGKFKDGKLSVRPLLKGERFSLRLYPQKATRFSGAAIVLDDFESAGG